MISKWFFSLPNENAKNELIDITHLKFINSELLFTRVSGNDCNLGRKIQEIGSYRQI